LKSDSKENSILTASQVKNLLSKTHKGEVANTAGNYRLIFEHDPLLQGAIRKNLLTERVDIVKELGWHRDGTTLTDVDVKYLQLYVEKAYGLSSENKIENAVAVVANENRYHPVQDYLNGLTWDGEPRIAHVLHRFLGAEENEYTYEVMKLFLLGAISRAFQPGCKFETMLCLVGGQGTGKSTFFRFLATQDDWFSDDLKHLDDENVYRKMQGHWIIEMSEMIATANAKSIEEIKSFLSRQKETYKIPYETHPADRKRQCVFGGSSNRLDFLPLDRSGNRRFLPVMVNPGQAEVHILEDEKGSRAYIDQLWAEAMTIYRSGEFRLTLSSDMSDYLKTHQADFMPEDTITGQILGWLEQYDGDKVCSRQLYAEALGHGALEPKQWELRDICDVMNNAASGWQAFPNPRRFPSPYGRQKGWERVISPDNEATVFRELTEAEAEQLGLPEEWLTG
jgi:predicted P-loop ATPase